MLEPANSEPRELVSLGFSGFDSIIRSSLVEFRFLGKWLESRMFAMKKSIQTVLLASAIANVAGSTAQAQCLLDIFGWGKSPSTPNPSAPPTYPYSSNYPVVPAGYPIQGQPVVGGMPYSAGYAGIPQSAISLGAPTNYNTSYFPVPTTYYRPVSDHDDALHLLSDASTSVARLVFRAMGSRW